MCLCSCTPCEGIHAQVTSQRGSGAPGKPGVLHTGEGDRSLSGILRTGEDTRKRILPGLDPWIVQWLASLQRLLSLVKEKTITFFTAVNLTSSSSRITPSLSLPAGDHKGTAIL